MTGQALPAGATVVGMYMEAVREARGVTTADAVRFLSTTHRTLTRMESGWTRFRESDVKRLLLAYGVPCKACMSDLLSLLTLSSDLFQITDRGAGWLTRLKACHRKADSIRHFTGMRIPTGLRTPEYDRHLKPSPDLPTHEEHVTVAEAGSRMITLFLDEAVLHRRVVPPDAMAEQFRALNASASNGALRLRVVPFTAGPIVPLTALTELTFTTHQLYAQETAGIHYSLGGPLTRSATLWFDALDRAALSPEESHQQITHATNHFTALAERSPRGGGRGWQPSML
ncbi:Helix-turn-helix domain-containing protein [Streptomyces zhaozhouensis]|uniref:Helix-turn-helix domain-containing protein n=1 Tax=Streptomyces zhaozhouensis TaxID=1300267 RepID=A0A286DZE5_9ACTN|nr:Scr1 family TA system antitoxin-like transcriptional regulator [Streptomyces zhaozhouensis]SOD64025.1 Helix-turn-helix domain-containing protein [Streptomyces zhaozhouensis]